MVVVYMYNIRVVFPHGQPVYYRNLERGKAFAVVVVPVYFFPVQQAIDINEVEIETELIGFFFDDGIYKPPATKIRMRKL